MSLRRFTRTSWAGQCASGPPAMSLSTCSLTPPTVWVTFPAYCLFRSVADQASGPMLSDGLPSHSAIHSASGAVKLDDLAVAAACRSEMPDASLEYTPVR